VGFLAQISSKEILEEFKEVLEREEVRTRFTYTERDVRKIVIALSHSARIVHIKSRFHVVKDDPKDDIVLATAYDGKADYIVSGDHLLLDLGKFKGIKIVAPKQMMNLAAKIFPELVLRF
jgi:putative PIN family toxin of toxin-antitoxin system